MTYAALKTEGKKIKEKIKRFTPSFFQQHASERKMLKNFGNLNISQKGNVHKLSKPSTISDNFRNVHRWFILIAQLLGCGVFGNYRVWQLAKPQTDNWDAFDHLRSLTSSTRIFVFDLFVFYEVFSDVGRSS